MKQVFISKSDSADMNAGMFVCRTLEDGGLSCWVSPRDVDKTRPFEYSIDRGIRECRLYVLVLSRAAMRSEHVARELQEVVAQNNAARNASMPHLCKPILIYQLEPCQRDPLFKHNLNGLTAIEAWRYGSDDARREALLKEARQALGQPDAVRSAPQPEEPTRAVPRQDSRGSKIATLVLAVLLTILFGSLLSEFAAAILPRAFAESDLAVVLFLAAAWFPARAAAGWILRWIRSFLKN